MVDEFPQAQVPWTPENLARHWPPGGIDRCTVLDCSVAASIGCSFFPGGFLSPKTGSYTMDKGAPSG